MHRRTFIASASMAAAAAIAGSPAWARQASPEAEDAAAGGAWSFTDDRGRTIELPETPTRILADTGAGIALYQLGITPVGLFGYPDVFVLPEELADLPFIDQSAGELDMEQIISLAPDLFVAQAWSADNPNDFAGFDESTFPGLTDIAPTACILAVVQPVDVSLARFEELAAALGADLTSEEIVASRDAFAAASESVRAAAAEKPGLKVMAISATEDGIYWANPTSASDLVYFRELGVDILIPDAPDAAMSGLWQLLSWEEIGKYEVDLFLNDDRSYAMSTEEMLQNDVFAFHPAAQAGQIGDWTIEYVPDYASVTAILETLAATLEESQIITE